MVSLKKNNNKQRQEAEKASRTLSKRSAGLIGLWHQRGGSEEAEGRVDPKGPGEAFKTGRLRWTISIGVSHPATAPRCQIEGLGFWVYYL